MGNHSTPPQQSGPGQPQRWIWQILLLFIVMVILTYLVPMIVPSSQIVPYSEIKEIIVKGEVLEVTLEEHQITAILSSDPLLEDSTLQAVMPTQGDPELLPLLEEHGVIVTAVAPSGTSILAYFLPWVFILGFYFWLTRTGAAFFNYCRVVVLNSCVKR